jgi:spore coat polysaccharide biosynthesis protein SpsF
MIPIIVTARMSSQRLPGKSLKPIASKPLLQWVVDNLRHTRAPIVVATSEEASDDPIAAWCAGHQVRYCRGPLDDLAARVMQAAQMAGAEAFVRISGDSPLIDPSLVSYAIKLYECAGVDVVTNVQLRTFPKGMSVEVIRLAALRELLDRHGAKADREHVTTVFYRSNGARVVNFTSGEDLGHVQLSVDSEADYRSIEQILEQAGDGVWSLGWRRIVQLLPPGQAAGAESS